MAKSRGAIANLTAKKTARAVNSSIRTDPVPTRSRLEHGRRRKDYARADPTKSVRQQGEDDEEMQEPERVVRLNQSHRELKKDAMGRIDQADPAPRHDLDRQPEQIEIAEMHDPRPTKSGKLRFRTWPMNSPETTKKVGILIGVKNSTSGWRNPRGADRFPEHEGPMHHDNEDDT